MENVNRIASIPNRLPSPVWGICRGVDWGVDVGAAVGVRDGVAFGVAVGVADGVAVGGGEGVCNGMFEIWVMTCVSSVKVVFP